MLSGTLGKFQQLSLLMTLRPSMPGNGGITGTEPVARIILSALNCCVEPSLLVTVTLHEASTVASPSKTSTLLPFMSTPTPFVIRLTTLSLNATALLISKVGGLSRWIPNSSSVSMLCITSAMCSMAFDGIQPTLRQVPPRYCFSTMATLAPSCAARMAAT